METNLAYGPGCALTWLPVNLAARELGLWSQCCEFFWGPAWQCKLLVDMARGSVLWLQLSGCGLWTQLGFVDLVQEPSLGLWMWLMNLAWDLDLVVDSRLWTCLPPCHVNVAACGPCLRARAWPLVDPESGLRSLPMDPPWACGPGCSWAWLHLAAAWLTGPAATCGHAWRRPQQASCLRNSGFPRVDPASSECGLLLADLAGAAGLIKLLV